jgi:TetR/AcrR family tetracycline transcriptional repressor
MYGVQLSTMATTTRAATSAKGPTRSPARGTAKERLSRDTVARAAIELVDAEGLDALTVRRLATGLGVTPMALYWHFKDKDALLDGVAEQLLSEVVLPDEDDSVAWDVQLRAALQALLAGLAAHPASLSSSRSASCSATPAGWSRSGSCGCCATAGARPSRPPSSGCTRCCS